MTDDVAELSKSRSDRGAIVLLGALTAIGPMSIDAYLPGLPTLARELGATDGAAQLTLSAFFFGLASAQMFWGPLSDRRGRRTPLLAGLALFMLASIGCAFAPNIELLALGRFVQAFGGAAAIVIARAIVRDRWSGAEAARILSLLVLVMGVAPIVAPSIGAVLLEVSTWRSVFVLLFVFGLALLIATAAKLPRGGPTREAEPLALALPALFRDRLFVTAMLGGGFAQAGLFAYIAGSSFVFVEHHHLTTTRFAWLFGVNAVGLVAGAQVNRFLLRHAAPGVIARAATLAALVSALVLVSRATVGPLAEQAILVFVFVSSYGLTASNATAMALENHASRAGLASAVLGSTQNAMAASATVVVGLLSDGTPRAMATVMLGCAIPATLSIALAQIHVLRSSRGRHARG